MSLLTVDVGGASETVLPFAKAGHAEPRQVGKRRYAFAGNERSMIRAESFVIPLIGANLPAATVATLRALFALGAQVVCQGDVFNNGNVLVTCSGEISDEMEVGGTYWIPTLTLTQVTAPTAGVFGLSVSANGSTTVTVTINGPRRFTISVAGRATTSATAHALRVLTASAAGTATTSSRTVRQQRTVSASGVATVSATINVIRLATASASGIATTTTRTVAQQITLAAVSGRATVTITGTKIP